MQENAGVIQLVKGQYKDAKAGRDKDVSISKEADDENKITKVLLTIPLKNGLQQLNKITGDILKGNEVDNETKKDGNATDKLGCLIDCCFRLYIQMDASKLLGRINQAIGQKPPIIPGNPLQLTEKARQLFGSVYEYYVSYKQHGRKPKDTSDFDSDYYSNVIQMGNVKSVEELVKNLECRVKSVEEVVNAKGISKQKELVTMAKTIWKTSDTLELSRSYVSFFTSAPSFLAFADNFNYILYGTSLQSYPDVPKVFSSCEKHAFDPKRLDMDPSPRKLSKEIEADGQCRLRSDGVISNEHPYPERTRSKNASLERQGEYAAAGRLTPKLVPVDFNKHYHPSLRKSPSETPQDPRPRDFNSKVGCFASVSADVSGRHKLDAAHLGLPHGTESVVADSSSLEGERSTVADTSAVSAAGNATHFENTDTKQVCTGLSLQREDSAPRLFSRHRVDTDIETDGQEDHVSETTVLPSVAASPSSDSVSEDGSSQTPPVSISPLEPVTSPHSSPQSRREQRPFVESTQGASIPSATPNSPSVSSHGTSGISSARTENLGSILAHPEDELGPSISEEELISRTFFHDAELAQTRNRVLYQSSGDTASETGSLQRLNQTSQTSQDESASTLILRVESRSVQSQHRIQNEPARVQLPPIVVHAAGSRPPWATRTPRIDLSRAANRGFVQLRDRRATYPDDWPCAPGIDPANMALSGFYRLGPGRLVRCFYCGLELDFFVPGNNIWDEHVRYRPTCAYLVAVMGRDQLIRTQIRLGRREMRSIQASTWHSEGTSQSTLPSFALAEDAVQPEQTSSALAGVTSQQIQMSSALTDTGQFVQTSSTLTDTGQPLQMPSAVTDAGQPVQTSSELTEDTNQPEPTPSSFREDTT